MDRSEESVDSPTTGVAWHVRDYVATDGRRAAWDGSRDRSRRPGRDLAPRAWLGSNDPDPDEVFAPAPPHSPLT